MTLLKQHRDPEEEIRRVIPGKVQIVAFDLVRLELERLARKRSSTGPWVRASLEFLSKRGLPIIEHREGPSDVDASLVATALAEKTPTAIATVDGEMREALKAFGLTAISPRKGSGLIVESASFPVRLK